MLGNGRFPDSEEMHTDEYGLRSMTNMDPSDLIMSARQWEALGAASSGKALDHMSMYGTDLTDEEYTANMYRMFINLPAEVITQGVSMIHTEFTKFFCAECFKTESIEQGGSLAKMRGIQQCFIIIQNRCVRATDEIYRMVNETAGHRPGTLKEFRAQEIALERQVRLLERSKFEPIGSRQEEIVRGSAVIRFVMKVRS